MVVGRILPNSQSSTEIPILFGPNDLLKISPALCIALHTASVSNHIIITAGTHSTIILHLAQLAADPER
jgi:hypothetical protein